MNIGWGLRKASAFIVAPMDTPRMTVTMEAVYLMLNPNGILTPRCFALQLKKEETGEWRFPGPNNTRPLKTGYFNILNNDP